MSTIDILTTALVLSNLIWMIFFTISHAQHMRAYHWMIGFRPPSTPTPVTTPDMRPSAAEELGAIFPKLPSEKYNGRQLSPTAGMGEISP